MRKNLKTLEKILKLYLELKLQKLSCLLMNKRNNLREKKNSLLIPPNPLRKKRKRSPKLQQKNLSLSLELPRKPQHHNQLLLKSPLIKNLQLRSKMLQKLKKMKKLQMNSNNYLKRNPPKNLPPNDLFPNHLLRKYQHLAHIQQRSLQQKRA